MTEALDKMVAAMVVELKRQSEFGKPGPCIYDDNPRDLGIDGRLDLKLVARAGLEALKCLPDAPGFDAEAVIDAILKEPRHDPQR